VIGEEGNREQGTESPLLSISLLPKHRTGKDGSGEEEQSGGNWGWG